MQSPTSPRHDFQQLPLPTTVNTTPVPRPQGGTTVSTIAGHNGPPSRSLPLVLGRTSAEIQAPNSPVQSSFPHLHSTHAGGIQPSMSFFRPSRPNHDKPDLSRPGSLVSIDDNENTGQDSESFHLGELNQRHSDVCDDEGSRPVSEIDTNTQNLLPKWTKPSREPLLPIADPSSNLFNRLSTSRDRTGPGSNYAAKNIVRTSFDRVMSLRRGLSFDSIRKTAPNRSSGEARPGKEGDGLNAYDLPPSSTRYEHTSFAAMYGDGSTDNRNYGPRTPISPSPDPQFNPRPPIQQPPLSAIPILNLGTKKPSRNHHRHPSNNKFFLRGRLLTGGDSPWAFITSFLLVLVIAGVWFGTTCVWWWQNESPAVAAIGIYMALLVISTMLATATTDPGILPRNLDPDPPYSNETPSDGGSRVPMPRDLKVRNDVVRTKYCVTCRTYRPPRSSHCKMCDNCVDGCDHHCQWVNNCVGRRNYTSFFVLLLSASLTLVLIICTSALHLYLLTIRENIDFRHALKRGAGSAVVFCLSILIFWPVVALLLYHMRLLLLNVTTIEQIRNQAHKSLIPDAPPPNPFSHGSWKRNLLNVLCRPAGYSWLNASAIATEDKREVNPALIENGGDIWDGQHHQR